MRKTTLVTLLLAAAACGRGEQAAADRDARLPQPDARPLGRLTLAESDTLYVGRPAGLAVDAADGTLYVSDAFWGRVLRFTPRGELVRTYGVRGEGPGELKAPGALEVADGAVLVADVGGNRLTRYGREDGEFLGSHRYRGVMTSIRAQGGSLWMGVLNRTRKTSLGTWKPDEAEIRPLGVIPPEFLQSEPLAGIYTGVQVAAWGDTVLAGYMGLNRLTLFRADGTPLRDLSVPVRTRRGEIPSVVKAMEEMEFPQMFAANSALFRMSRLPGGGFALVHYDQDIKERLISARVYLSVLSSDLSRACVDREIPVTRDAQPYTAFRGDTLFVLQQRVAGERATTYVDRYLVDEAACARGGARLAVKSGA